MPTVTASRHAASMDATSDVVAHIEDDARSHPAVVGLRGVLTPAGVVLAIGLIFVSVYLAAFHAPSPHHLPIAAAGPARSVQLLTSGLNHELPGGFTVKPAPSASAAGRAVEDRSAFGALVVSGDRVTLLYAGANGPAVTSLLKGTVGGAAQLLHMSVTSRDILPATAGDSRGLSIFYTAFGLVLAGFLFGSVTYQTAPRLQLRWRLVSMATFAVAGGVLITLIAKAFGAMPGPFLGLAAVIALMAAAVAGASMVLVRLLGGVGVSVGSVVLLVLGNSTSGGSLPADYLPAWLHPLARVLPVGVGVRALDGLAYFHHDGLITALAVLSVWIVASVAVLALRDDISGRRVARPTVGAHIGAHESH